MDFQATNTIPIPKFKDSVAVNNHPYLSVSIGKDMGKVFRIDKKMMTVGRSPEADIVIDDDTISRIHFNIRSLGPQVYFLDNNSTNGVYINGEKLPNGSIEVGANIHIGGTVMKLEMLAPCDVELRQSLFKRANFDLLTGAYNRHYFVDHAVKELALVQREHRPLKLVMLDLDHFKKINDQHGHSAGDYVLREFSDLIGGFKREYDLFCRYGGEEFILMLLGSIRLSDVGTICERIRGLIENHKFEFGGEIINVTASLGGCFVENTADLSIDSIIEMADKALYVSKESGRNMVTIVTDVE